jgi:glycosyltransferase involved in cell wall biosynthesis
MAHEHARNNQRKLKILISLLYYFPHRTGLTIHVQQVAEELVRRGHEVTVITARYNLNLPRDEEMHNGVRVIRLWAPIHISRGMLMPAYPWAMFLAMRQSDVVSVHTPMLETALIAILAKLAGIHVIPTHHGDLILPPKPFNRFIQWTMFQFYKVLAHFAPQLIGYSRDYAENSYYLQPYLDKTSVIYPPVLIPEPDREHAQKLRRQWQRGDGPVIGYGGRFVQEKRPDLAIRALEVINQHYPDARIVFAGEYDIPYENTWEMQRELVEKYRDQLIFLGLLEGRQELADFYAACDVIVLPSDTECFALVQVEAMLCGTPMVMTDIPGGRVPVQVTGMGKLAKQGDAVSIGEALVEVIRHRDQYVRSREEIEQIFSFQETVDRYEEIFTRYARSQGNG